MYRQVLTQSTGDAADSAVFATALAIAQRFGGQLEYLHVRPDPAEILLNMASADAGSGYVIAGLMEAAERDAAAGEVRARQACMAFCAALVALTGTRTSVSPWYTTKACPFTTDLLIAARTNSRRNRG